jgi:hypothetical protein
MKVAEDIRIKAYHVGADMIFDMVETNDSFEFWIYSEDAKVKMYCIQVTKLYNTAEEAMHFWMNVVYSYINEYRRKYYRWWN